MEENQYLTEIEGGEVSWMVLSCELFFVFPYLLSTSDGIAAWVDLLGWREVQK